MKSWAQFLFAVSLIVFSVSTFAAPPVGVDGKTQLVYNRLIVFGDSLSDVGTYAAVASWRGGGKFTTNPGKIWAEILAEKLNLPMKVNRQEGFGLPLKIIGGFNYAQGGSRVAVIRGQPASQAQTMTARPLTEQVGLFLGAHQKFNPTDLILLQGGANDIFNQLNQVRDKLITPAQAVVNAAKTAEDLSALIANIRSKGGEHVVVINLPAMQKTPRVLTMDAMAQALVASLVGVFNQTLALRMLELNVYTIDFYSFDLRFNDEAAQLGFKDLTHAACKIQDLPIKTSLLCNAKTLIEPGADLSYKFADELHPTTGYSKYAGEFIHSQVLLGR